MLRETRSNAGHLTMQHTKRSNTGGEIVTVSGYATVFNSLSRDLGYREVIDPQAFSQCDMSQCLALWMHSDNALPLGRLTNGSLRLSIDRLGLRFAVDLDPQVTFHNDLMRLVKSQTIDQCSFGFLPRVGCVVSRKRVHRAGS
jgi:HK97 family phage prohead protease